MLEYTLPLISYNNTNYVILSRKNETEQFSLPSKLNTDLYIDIKNKLDIECIEFDKKKLDEITFQNNSIQLHCSYITLNTDKCNKNNLIIIVPLNDVLDYTRDLVTIYSTTLLKSNINNLEISKKTNKSSENSDMIFIDIFICSILCNLIFFMYILIFKFIIM